uniref:Cathepsin propeptide inhibitor domain-containing protein n=1 Tax=Zea mays TaxID=4577 RepID=C0PNW5_MAIZE|nr:unknown [Zea mays]
MHAKMTKPAAIVVAAIAVLSVSLLAGSSCLALARPSGDFSIVGYSEEDLSSHESLAELFERWLSRHRRAYASLEEKLRRFQVFKDNLHHIDETNRKVSSYWLGLNEFADLTHDEFKATYLGLRSSVGDGGSGIDDDDEPPQVGGLAEQGRGDGGKEPGPVRQLLGLLHGGRRRGHQPDRHGQPHGAVGAGAHRLRHGRQQRLQRRPHGLRLLLHRTQRRPPHGGGLPVPHGGRHLPAQQQQREEVAGIVGGRQRRCRGGHHLRVRGRAEEQRAGAAQSAGATARQRRHRGLRQELPVLQRRRLRWALRHAAGPRGSGRRLRDGGQGP